MREPPLHPYSSGLSAFLFLGLVLSQMACQAQKAADPREADERAIRAVDEEMLKAAASKDLERILFFFSEDASMFPPNAPIASGKEAIRAVWSQMFANPGLPVTWQTVKVEVSRSGDLGYLHGTYELSMSDPKGKTQTDRGKWVSVVKKLPDGSWKVVADIFNSDLPLPTISPR